MNSIERDYANTTYPVKHCTTNVAWGAIIGGAFAAAAISLILLILGSALGLSTVSPWSSPESVTSFTVKTAIWLIVMQWVASGVGGYLSGRLRSKWVEMHDDEVYFRDTAHGFLSWAVATVITASLLASAATAVVQTGAQGAIAAVGGAAAGAGAAASDNMSENADYYIDSLFRTATPTQSADSRDSRAETAQIIMMGLKNGNLPEADKQYLASQISARTGVDNVEANRRIDDAIAQLNAMKEKAKQLAEEARKAAMKFSIYMFLSLLVGAFIASASAALGGKHRDEY